MKPFNDLTQPEILALAISSEEEDGRIYADFAEGLREHHPDTAHVFSDMAAEENDHRRMLIDLYVSKFGSESVATRLGRMVLVSDETRKMELLRVAGPQFYGRRCRDRLQLSTLSAAFRHTSGG